jgi:hypothetical protein
MTKLGDNGMPIICSSDHPDRTPEKYDIQIGQSCFEKNWKANRLVDISKLVPLTQGYQVFAFRDWLAENENNISQ